MTTSPTHPRPAVELTGFVDNYLYGCLPAAGCGVCTVLVKELEAARQAKDHGTAYDSAAEIRNHPHPAPRIRTR
ncbi:hypothetical protein [Streptomyces sp. CBMA152]|uniref:hypothetical protein n=1 Tax=Streptomyces sp. CBMA152 TaxID=1896312 RepID=UPI001660CD38|nr:hypothetical protein [Streptomyces sp. CBMA152]MBD0745330.1 hypothetical protein [Streptomyces sp. CBMA152]